MKKKILTILLIISMLPLTGCDWFGNDEEPEETPTPAQDTETGEQEAAWSAADDVFTLNYSTSHSMNPLTTGSALNIEIAPLIYEGLYTVDERFYCEPTRLLDSAETEDGQLWYFYINTSVKFHDGKGLTAEDVRYSIFRAMSAEQYRSRLGIIAGISFYDDDTVVISLNYPNSQFPALLNIPVIPAGTIDEDAPAGTGPYKLDPTGKKLVLNSDHPKAGAMPLDTIYLREFKNAEDIITSFEESALDIVVNDPTGLADLGYGAANDIRYYNTSTMHYLGFNAGSDFFSNSNCRAAMNYVVNRSYVVTNVMGGGSTASTLPISPVSYLYNSGFAQEYEFSLEKCGAILYNANVRDHDDDGLLEYMLTGIPMDINIRFIVNSESAVKVSAARRIAEDMRSLGLTVELSELGWGDYTAALKNGNFDMYYAEVMLTADFNLRSLLVYGGSMNYGNFSDPGCEEAVNQYLSASEADRQDACDLMCQHIISSAPIVTIAFEKKELITHRGVVSGAEPTQYNVFNKFEDWTITP